MHPKRKRRLTIVLLALLVIGAASALILNAFQSNLVFFHTPSEIVEGKVDASRTIRMGGLVSAGSLKRESGGLAVSFSVTDTARSVPVRYQGILPDLFKEGRGTVVQGHIGPDGVFVADQVLAKHDEKYMPPEAQDAINRAGETVVK
jgi:cytochrome c-type biogenesis protein CcmE